MTATPTEDRKSGHELLLRLRTSACIRSILRREPHVLSLRVAILTGDAKVILCAPAFSDASDASPSWSQIELDDSGQLVGLWLQLRLWTEPPGSSGAASATVGWARAWYANTGWLFELVGGADLPARLLTYDNPTLSNRVLERRTPVSRAMSTVGMAAGAATPATSGTAAVATTFTTEPSNTLAAEAVAPVADGVESAAHEVQLLAALAAAQIRADQEADEPARLAQQAHRRRQAGIAVVGGLAVAAAAATAITAGGSNVEAVRQSAMERPVLLAVTGACMMLAGRFLCLSYHAARPPPLSLAARALTDCDDELAVQRSVSSWHWRHSKTAARLPLVGVNAAGGIVSVGRCPPVLPAELADPYTDGYLGAPVLPRPPSLAQRQRIRPLLLTSGCNACPSRANPTNMRMRIFGSHTAAITSAHQMANHGLTSMLLSVTKSDNSNVVVYRANILRPGVLDPAQPITAFGYDIEARYVAGRRRQGEQRDRFEFKRLQQMYGSLSIQTESSTNQQYCTLSSLVRAMAPPGLPGRFDLQWVCGRVFLVAAILGRRCFIEKLFVSTKPRRFNPVPQVLWVRIFGTAVSSGKKMMETLEYS